MAHRHGRGIRGLQAQKERKERMAAAGRGMMEEEMTQMKAQLADFKTKLEAFASKRKKDIRQDPAFRRDFQQMCTHIGVDPLASNKGFWAQLLGVGDFYYQLAVQVVETCLGTRDITGGLMELEEVRKHVNIRRGTKVQQVSTDDILQAVGKLKKLGSGYAVIKVGSKDVVQSVPMELSVDHNAVLSAATCTGFVTLSALQSTLGWTPSRTQTTLDQLVRNGVAWVDTQSAEISYWMPAMMHEVAVDEQEQGAAAE